MRRLFKEFTKGITIENPTFGLVLGLCPTLAVSTSVVNALGMGIAASFVLVCSNLIISSLRRLIPDQIRIPCYIVIIATFVTIVELLMQAYFPALNSALGIFVPLIVVNCIVLGRAEAFAIKNGPALSFLDGIGYGVGYTFMLILMALVREPLGFGTILGQRIMPQGWTNWVILTIAPGAFFLLGVYLWIFRTIAKKTEN